MDPDDSPTQADGSHVPDDLGHRTTPAWGADAAAGCRGRWWALVPTTLSGGVGRVVGNHDPRPDAPRPVVPDRHAEQLVEVLVIPIDQPKLAHNVLEGAIDRVEGAPATVARQDAEVARLQDQVDPLAADALPPDVVEQPPGVPAEVTDDEDATRRLNPTASRVRFRGA